MHLAGEVQIFAYRSFAVIHISSEFNEEIDIRIPQESDNVLVGLMRCVAKSFVSIRSHWFRTE